MILENVQKNTLQQKLILTNELKQSLNILQMSIPELNIAIDRALEENPLLEIMPTIHKKQRLAENKDSLEHLKPLKINNDISLKADLMEQLYGVKADRTVIFACKYIIESLDEKGYLSCDIMELAEQLGFSKEHIEAALKIVQGFSPTGVAARSLSECLALQLMQQPKVNSIALEIVNNHLTLLAENKLRRLAEVLEVSFTEIVRCVSLIKALEPKPSRGYNPDNGSFTSYIVPEAYVYCLNDDIVIKMNEHALPRLIVSTRYKNTPDFPPYEEATRKYIKEKEEDASAVIRTIAYRNETIYNIIVLLAKLQKSYFLKGEAYLKPMHISYVAGLLGVHSTTVYRAIKNKYIYTPFGTIELKNLFAKSQGQGDSSEVSILNIKQEIRKIISSENRSTPLSDSKICEALLRLGISLPRRTVAKYRTEMNIAPSSKRKEYC